MDTLFSPDPATPPFAADPAAILRATGLLRSFAAEDYSHVNAVLQAMIDDPDPDALTATFSALAVIALLATTTAVSLVKDGLDVDQTLSLIASNIIGYRPPDTPGPSMND